MKPAFLISLTLLGAFNLAAAAELCAAPSDPWRAAVLVSLNALRNAGGSCGSEGRFGATHALRWSAVLETMAARQAGWLNQRGVLEHIGSQGEELSERARASGYAYRVVAENLAAGRLTTDEVLAGWRASPAHCANLLSPRVREVALACVPGPGGPWWVMALGAQLDDQAAAPMTPPITPPPRQTSPSYTTADWPGVTAH